MKLAQLYLRDLFWLVLVVTLGCAWWLDRSDLARYREAWYYHFGSLDK